ncbi:MAG: hypothetical protein ACREHG_09875 [Candidatus Saccharimonadales bacterium]
MTTEERLAKLEERIEKLEKLAQWAAERVVRFRESPLGKKLGRMWGIPEDWE